MCSAVTADTPDQAHWAQLHCPLTCNPECSPSVPHISFGLPSYIPSASLKIGHRNCNDKLTVETHWGNTKNSGTVEPKQAAVCGKCASDKFMLKPAYVIGHRVVGVCQPIDEHWLWGKPVQDMCKSPQYPCHGEVFSQCEKFVGGFGEYRDAEYQSIQTTHKEGSMQVVPKGSPLAFTCSRLYAHDFAAADPIVMSQGQEKFTCAQKIYRIVQTKIASCYSTNEGGASDKQEMECVNRKQVKSCHYKTVQLPEWDGTDWRRQWLKDNPVEAIKKFEGNEKKYISMKMIWYAKQTEAKRAEAIAKCRERFTPAIKQTHYKRLSEKGVIAAQWSLCSELDERVATSLS